MRIIDCKQGTDEWLQIRGQIPTASQFSKIITPAKGTKSTSWEGYAAQLVAQGLGEYDDDYTSAAMEYGTENEPKAIAAYEWDNDCDTDKIGFIVHDSGLFGCSPDAVILWPRKGLEVKCPKLSTLVKWKSKGGLPLEHKCQVQGSMLVTGCEQWDFYAWHEKVPALQITVERDDEFCKKLNSYLFDFIELLNRMRIANGLGELKLASKD